MLIDLQVHSSQHPDQVRSTLLASLRQRRVHPKFHYVSYGQSRKWLRLHGVLAPLAREDAAATLYDPAFAATLARLTGPQAHVISLGCGAAQKDALFLRLCQAGSKELVYSPVDVSLPLVLLAHEAARPWVAASYPLVCDLMAAPDLGEILADRTLAGAGRVVLLFGMMPNLEPEVLLPVLQAVLRAGDLLLVNANLVPGDDYRRGVQQVLPQYANELTADWLMTLLFDLGVERHDGELTWRVERSEAGFDLLRITAWFRFRRARLLAVEGEEVSFAAGDEIRLFFSYRYTPERLRSLLAGYGLVLEEQWIAVSGEEGVFLCRNTCNLVAS